MKNFFKTVLAVIVGFIILQIIGFLFILMLFSVGTSSTSTSIKDNSILSIKLDKPVHDRASSNPMMYLDPFSMSANAPLGLNNILSSIEKAKNDSRIKGIYMDLSEVNTGVANLEEIRGMVKEFRQSGKFVIAYADNYSQSAYYLASVADRVYMNPFGSLVLNGMGGEVMFYKGLLDKLGVEMQIIRHGKFKSAVEPYIMDKMSPESKEQTTAYVSSIWNTMLETIAESRDLTVEQLNTITNNLEIRNADDAFNKGFVDKLMYKDELISELTKLMSVKKEKELNLTDPFSYLQDPKLKNIEKEKIAVIYASGSILYGKGNKNINSTDFSKAIKTASADSSIKAIVLRINSPGGDAQASEIIARELELARAYKPVIISMGALAASGGYWIATPSDAIISNKTTITGSIGVFGMIPNVKKGMEEKLGLKVDVVKTNTHSDLLSVYKPMTETEKAFMQNRVEHIYSKFLEKVSKSRNMSTDSVDNIGQGRVWSGVDAKRLNLVDEFGGLSYAIKFASQKANLTNYSIEEFPKEPSTMEMFMKSFGASIKNRIGIDKFDDDLFNQYEEFKSIIKDKGIMARMPYDIDIK